MKRLSLALAAFLLAGAARAAEPTVVELHGDYRIEISKIDPTPTPSPTPKPSPTPTATPTPTPTPPVTTLPGGYRVVPKNMKLQENGFYRSNDLPTERVAYLQARLDKDAVAGQVVTFTYQQRTNVIKDGKKNLKDSRNWISESTNYDNDYTGRGLKAGADQLACEDGKGTVRYQKTSPTNWNVAYFSWEQKADVIQTIVREYRYADAGKSNGWARITIDGKKVFESEGWYCHGPRGDFGAQMVYAPNAGDTGDLPAGSYYEARILGLTVK